MAEVVAVGPGTKDVSMEVKPGDKVVFSKYGGTEIKYQGEEYTIMRQDDILAVVEQLKGVHRNGKGHFLRRRRKTQTAGGR